MVSTHQIPTSNDLLNSEDQKEISEEDDIKTHPGLSRKMCHGQCHAGYYCPEGSTSGYAYKCGHDNVYCPKGSGAPFIVSNGYYSVRRRIMKPIKQYRYRETYRNVTVWS